MTSLGIYEEQEEIILKKKYLYDTLKEKLFRKKEKLFIFDKLY
jgi:hypothetical protein